MRSALLLLVLVSVLLSSGSQVLLKRGMISAPVRTALANQSDHLPILLTVFSTPSIILGLACFGLSALVWLFVLARIPLSSAYPFVALGIVVTVLAGRLLFGEALSIAKLIGVALIVAGIAAVAAGG